MTLSLGINGFGRIGRLVCRVVCDWPDVRVARINDSAGDAATFAHLLNFDSVHGRWTHDANADDDHLLIGERRIPFTRNAAIGDTDWSGCDVVIDATGRHKTVAVLQGYLDQGVRCVVVSAPVKEPGALNVVLGVNHDRFDASAHRIVTAASCTTNCLAPVVKVVHETFGIRHGSITTIHDVTNTQSILDQAHKVTRCGCRWPMHRSPTACSRWKGAPTLPRSTRLWQQQPPARWPAFSVTRSAR
jgi:glyceraldehyde 3-phosphate dehydrogenase